MLESPAYSPRVDEALNLAACGFRHRRRKGTDIPYLSHLLQVAVHVMEGGGDEDQCIAALLHDYLEDVEGATVAELERRFGFRVARVVERLSDTDVHPKPPWRPRKERHIASLRGAPPDVRLVAAADKLHNVESLCRDVEREGSRTFERFRGGREGTLWYHRQMCEVLGEGWHHPIMDRLRAAVRRLQALSHSAAGVEPPS